MASWGWGARYNSSCYLRAQVGVLAKRSAGGLGVEKSAMVAMEWVCGREVGGL